MMEREENKEQRDLPKIFTAEIQHSVSKITISLRLEKREIDSIMRRDPKRAIFLSASSIRCDWRNITFAPFRIQSQRRIDSLSLIDPSLAERDHIGEQKVHRSLPSHASEYERTLPLLEDCRHDAFAFVAWA
eukprot:TRINITY_DN2690_c1_g1_i1.p2 TRINITY_DN2690_c1_g1~~TRINITY_DN2690_c1_g1_i1.p2  ORF type:complete len:132 (+),score=18.54 TRINITY_DN2690_c1_g1_i1:505-900(+)